MINWEMIWERCIAVGRFLALILAVVVASGMGGSISAYLVITKYGTIIDRPVAAHSELTYDESRVKHTNDLAEVHQKVQALTKKMAANTQKADKIVERITETDTQLARVDRAPVGVGGGEKVLNKADWLLGMKHGKVVER